MNATVAGRDIEVERVKDTAGPNLPAPNVVLKAMVKLEIPELMLWTENTIEFEPNPEEENATAGFRLPQQLNELLLMKVKNAFGYDSVTVSPTESEDWGLS